MEDLLPPPGWHEQADGSLVCPHRDLSVCPACAQRPEAVEVVGAHFWLPGELRELAAEMGLEAAQCSRCTAAALPDSDLCLRHAEELGRAAR